MSKTAPKKSTTKTNVKANANGSAHLGVEATLWGTADKLRGNLNVAEYKHVCWKIGTPQLVNTNCVLQHFFHHLIPEGRNTL